MGLSIWVITATTLAGLNILLLLVLGGIWINNYRQFRTLWILGLVIFAVMMLLENVAAIYSFFEWGALYADTQFAKLYITSLRGLQILGLGAITYATWQ